MTFERTATGQANRTLFYDVDWIIYTEGGAEEVGPVRSYDSLFWSGVFRAVNPQVNVKAIPRGGKAQLEELAAQVQDQRIEHVIVAMDRDYDSLKGRIINHPQVVYTAGYSFENDIFEQDSISGIFQSLAPVQVDGDVLKNEVDNWISSFLKIVRWPLKIDLCAVHNAVKGFDRKRPQRYFQSNAYGCEPVVSRDRLIAESDRILSQCAERTFGTDVLPSIQSSTVIGHIWEVFVFRLISFLHSKYCNTSKVTYDQLRSAGISFIQIRILQATDGDVLVQHYRQAVDGALT